MNVRLRLRFTHRVAASRAAHRAFAIVRVPEVMPAAFARSAAIDAHCTARREAAFAARIAPLIGGRRARTPAVPLDSSR
ncbi:hypothetical protein [Burkholderia thailandensis]|uniref:hypothetical protein n=1 Tax=Burkholderia thailandensis TaxID=57975 RepID=UPI0001B41222|nr:hypothetical protein [Burkholderia thailandensis]MCS6503110.1 hypothetical protein [Burkholderia thailandensis]MCS6520135.1 hypothetical protein [Burkholderia thailandensis]MUV30124.1 hypothetical protein [Burkholderia thailandensis]NBC91433.1 hypothetical protein [Burkholderia thailandensis]NBD05304.1 hypothetical protein [Burkholderia thailandensis]